MDILAGSDASSAALLVPVATNTEWTVWRRAAPGADTMRVAVKDVRGEVAFDGPVAEGGFKGEKGGEGLVGGYGGH